MRRIYFAEEIVEAVQKMIEHIPLIGAVAVVAAIAVALWPRRELCTICHHRTKGMNRVKYDGGYAH